MTALNRITASSTTPSRNTVALRVLGLALPALSTANCSGPESLPAGPSPVAIGPSPVTVAPAPSVPAPAAPSAPAPSASNACPPGLQQGTVTASIDGVPFAADFSVLATSAATSPQVPGVNRSWSTDEGNASGAITITSISATGASGTFSFVASPDVSSGASGTKRVTNGAFNVRF